ncbi:MAG: CcmD family protein [Cytophagaceae bacterium]|nr:CcmD family protein [Cytophagaceae bacterium]MBK9934217.1 CcmD family protein [Cytophagaceae bacterium]MBL0300666.1 CcmD family protein [Cytophagaceae bacterium]MBL0327608.1 CcmD family protein [Cytophagaceae bacterium]
MKLISILIFAALQRIEMADSLRANGKIYVVAGVFSIIALGIIGYLFSLDRKIKKLEEEIKDK